MHYLTDNVETKLLLQYAIDWLFNIFKFKEWVMKKMTLILTPNSGRSQVTYVNIYIGWLNECQLY